MMRMKNAVLGFLAAVAVFAQTPAMANVCLQQASNQDLVNELSRRLYVGGGIGSGAQANYSCDLYGDLRMGLLGPSGTEVKVDISVRNAQVCAAQRTQLTQLRSRIHSVSMVAACDLYGDLERYSFTPDGRIQKLAGVAIRNMNVCLEQARTLNQR